MKKAQIILAILLLSFLVSCSPGCTNNSKNVFTYVIQGDVVNGDGIEISLYIPSMGMDKRQTVKIMDGKYLFSGEAKLPEAAVIRFEKDIVEPGSISCLATVFIEPDTVIYDFEINRRDFGNCFNNHNYKSGRNNLYYANSKAEFFESASTWIYGDQKKMDSMHQYVYPDVRTKTLNTYEDLFFKNENQAVSLYFLDHLTINSRRIFDPEYLTEEEKDRLKYFLEGIDPVFHSSKEYIYLNNYLTNIQKEDKAVQFKDFQLLDAKNETNSLSDYIKSNKISLLYFWHSGCGPCRKFNRVTSEIINDLKKQGIGIISINSDQSMEYWRKSSEQDSITWINLYAGDKAEISAYYDIHRYPSTYVFDNKLKLLGTGISRAEDLMQYLED